MALAHDLQVIADPARLRILSLIASHSPRPSSVTELVDRLGLSQSTVSHHLRTLVDAGLLVREQSGTWGLYRARGARLRELARLIAPGDLADPGDPIHG
ncbi:winged helix-turn-helix transcriptional regulator [Pseudoclavibacter chungangensis]|uniref:Winged helix-turn-helix transcriptional regulator n=2 Tax=Pseudoclavibacter chungangensis TaxID=587635 RepID=A0A7J5BQ65_9MICO|nr:metalloregulator ArsR/SmtB family transcription factor [Pseudoclavibacter chungangensis]KAB1655690.1 winged helix-turn-helix transcriptional regulator [Pseudoclavibacter chungangensis]